MEKTKLGVMSVEIPEGFYELSEEERRSIKIQGKGEGSVFKDPDRRMFISIGWKKAGFMVRMLTSKDFAKSMEPRIDGSMRKYGYQFRTNIDRPIGGLDASGFGYTYTAQDIAMYAESYAIKNGKLIYYIHFYINQEAKDEGQQTLNQILDSVEWEAQD